MLLVKFLPRCEITNSENYCEPLSNISRANQNKQLDHAPFLGPSDYHPFLNLKKHLGGKRHKGDNNLKTTVNQWLLNQAADFSDKRIQNFVARYEKYLNLNNGGSYGEK